MSASYAKNILWTNLIYLSTLHKLPWIMAGDFNVITSIDAKSGSRPASLNQCLSFTQNMEKCNSNDLGYKWPSFTWSNKRLTNKHSLIRERLDRFLFNDLWLENFPNSIVFHLFSPISDHRTILLTIATKVAKTTPFRFESMWLFDPNFPNVISQ